MLNNKWFVKNYYSDKIMFANDKNMSTVDIIICFNGRKGENLSF